MSEVVSATTLNSSLFFEILGQPSGGVSPDDVNPCLSNAIIKSSDLHWDKKAIGSGSFGRVHKGMYNGVEVAVKFLTARNSVSHVSMYLSHDGERVYQELNDSKKRQVAELAKALEKEVRVLKDLECSSIVKLYGVCLNPAAIVTEYCSNNSLFDYLKRARAEASIAETLTWTRRLKIAYDVACGMRYLHFRPIPALHRDLKSPNLVLDKDLKCKICDFNTSSFIDSRLVASTILASNPLWLAPEILKGHEFTKKSDVYPFGTILWELLTWHTPFHADTMNRNLMAIQFGVIFKNERPITPSNEELRQDKCGPCPIYEEYTDLIKKCWITDPEKRPTFEEIEGCIRDFLRKIENTDNSSEDTPFSIESLASEWNNNDTESAPPRMINPPVPRNKFVGRIRRKSLFSFFSKNTKSGALRRSSHIDKGIEERIETEIPYLAGYWHAEESLDENGEGSKRVLTTGNGTASGTDYALDCSDSEGEMTNVATCGSINDPQSIGSVDMDRDRLQETQSSGLSEMSPSQYRWGKIRKVVHTILDRKKYAKFIGIVESAQLQVLKASETGDEDLLASLDIVEESENENESEMSGSKGGKSSNWRKIRKHLLPNSFKVDFWDIIYRHVRAQNELRSMSQASQLALETAEDLEKRCKALDHWGIVRKNFLESDLEEYPRTPNCWTEVLDVVCPRQESDVANLIQQQQSNQSQIAQNKSSKMQKRDSRDLSTKQAATVVSLSE